jgi:hypothetical protein
MRSRAWLLLICACSPPPEADWPYGTFADEAPPEEVAPEEVAPATPDAPAQEDVAIVDRVHGTIDVDPPRALDPVARAPEAPAEPDPNVGSGVLGEETRAIPADTVRVRFLSLVAGHIRAGQPASVTIAADDNLLAKVTTTSSTAGALTIDAAGPMATTLGIFAQVTVPVLEDVVALGLGDVQAVDVDSARFRIRIDSVGSVTAAGTSNHLRVTLNGSGHADARALVVNGDAIINVAGTGTAFVRVTGEITGSITGLGQIVYFGTPASIDPALRATGRVVSGGP